MSSDVWREVSQLAPCLYVSGVSALNDKTLENLGINVIVNSATNLANFQTRDKSIVTVKVPVHDVSSANLRPYFKSVAELVRANELGGGKTLIHCMMGVSRSVSLCMAYLVTFTPSAKSPDRTMDVYEALDHVKKRRGIAHPNPGFMRQLVTYESNPETAYNPILLTNEEKEALEVIHLTIAKLNDKEDELCRRI